MDADIWAIAPGPPAALRTSSNPVHSGHRFQAFRGLLRSSSHASAPRIWELSLCSPNTLGPAACPLGRGQCFSRVQEIWALPPDSPKFGHRPRVFQRTGRCPRTLRTAPLGSRSPSAASAVRRRALAGCLSSQCARRRRLQPAVSSPPPPPPGPAPCPHTPWSSQGWRSPRAATQETGRGAGARCGHAPRWPRSLGPGAPKPAPLSFALCKDHNRGESVLAAPKLGGQGAGRGATPWRGAPLRAVQRLQPSGQEDSGGRASWASAVVDGGVRGEPGADFPPPAYFSPRRGAGDRVSGVRAGRRGLCVV